MEGPHFLILKFKEMRRKVSYVPTQLEVDASYEGERIEEKIQRVVNNGEAIKDGAPLVFTERKDGVRPEHDVRTDRFDIAIDAMDAVSKTTRAKREGKVVNMDEKKAEGEAKKGDSGGDTGGESTQGTK